MKLKLLLLTLVTIMTTMGAYSQVPAKISGMVSDASGNAVFAVNIMLCRAKDSSLVKTEISSKTGNFKFDALKAGAYFIRTSMVGMGKTSSAVINLKEGENVTAAGISLRPDDKNLQGVTVSSAKPMVEVKADKMIVNVEGTINAVGNDALELLRKSPGVVVDKDDNLSLAGKNGVQVYIDGKPSPLSGADLASYLKSIQSSQIEVIEIITNPSAKYEAAGNAGIINIKLKKNKTLGTNGSMNAGYNIGVYAKLNGGFSLNHRNAKTNLFGTYNISEGLNESIFTLNRQSADTQFNQTNRLLSYNRYNHNFKAGADFFINKISTIGVLVNGNISSSDITTEGPMSISYIPTNTLVKILKATSDNEAKRSNVNFNLNYRYAVTGGKELNMDADYGIFNIRSNQFQPNNYYDATGAVNLYNNVYRMISPTDINVYSFKTDYEQDFKKGRLGVGGKIGYVKTDNDFQRYNVYPSGDSYDKDKSNRFGYSENINALYVNYNKGFKGFTLQAGLRAENTVSDGKSTGLKINPQAPGGYDNYDSSIHKNYTDLFPSAAVTFNKNPKKQFGITYSRRIDRPAYQDLNPFEFKINDYTYMKGNTQLRPQYTNSFGLSFTYMYKLNFSFNYSHVKDIFTQIPDTTEKSKSFLTKKNLATQDVVSLNISYPFQLKWYSFFVNMNTNYSQYRSNNFGGGDRNINVNVAAVSFFMQNSFNLGKGYKAELSGFYNSPSVYQGTFQVKSLYSIDGGIQKTVLKGKGTVKASVSDLFNTLQFRGHLDYTGQHSDFVAHWESRQFKLNFNFRFGNAQVKATRQRKAATEEENKRTQSSGGIGTGGN